MAKKQQQHHLSGPGNAADVMTALEVAYASKQKLGIVGAPGVGKTAVIRQWSRQHGAGEPICVVGSQIDPTDITGLPYPSEHNTHTEYLVPRFQHDVEERAKAFEADPDHGDGPSSVLFLDEFTNTPRSVQASLLKIIGERRFANGNPVPDSCMIVCAMNPADSAADYCELSLPMVNRMMFVSFMPSASYIAEGIAKGWDEACPDPDPVLTGKAREKATRDWRAMVGQFVGANSAQMHRMPDHVTKGASGTSAAAAYQLGDCSDTSEKWIVQNCWASPRSWEALADVLGCMSPCGELNEVQLRLARGLVGTEGATALSDYAHKHARIDPYSIIKKPESMDWEHCSFNDGTESANSVVDVLGDCDGRDGRPSPADVVEFYNRVCGVAGHKKVPGAATYFAAQLSGSGSARAIVQEYCNQVAGNKGKGWSLMMAMLTALTTASDGAMVKDFKSRAKK